MEIILKEDIVNLGYKNDIVTVKSGYGRNKVQTLIILDSSMVEHSAVNRVVVGSSPTRGVFFTSSRQEKLSSLLLLQRKCWLKS